MTHNLKTLPQYFDKLKEGQKNFEIRLNDRDYQVGDILKLIYYCEKTDLRKRIMESDDGEPLLDEQPLFIERKVTYIMHGPKYGLKKGWVIMQLQKIKKEK